MRVSPVIFLLIAASAVCGPARAQQVLDRLQAPERSQAEAQVPERPPPRVDVQLETAATPSEGREILVGAITLSGLQALQPADFAGVIEPRLGQVLDDDALRALTGAITQQAQARGFAFATAVIEPQTLANGVLTVTVNEGRIDEVRVEGADLASVHAALAPLVTGAPARLADVERRLLIAEDIDGVDVRSSRYVREGDRGVLVVEVAKDPFSATVTLSNQGTRPVGPEQVRIDAEVNGLLASDDSLTLSYTGTPLQPGELNYGFARYEKRVSATGTEIALSGSLSRSRPGAYLESLSLRSRSWHVAASVLQPLLRRRNASLWFQGEAGLRGLLQWRNGTLVRRDRLAVVRGTVYGYTKLAGGWLRAGATLSQGLGLLDATEPGDPLASRADADGTFTTLYGWTEWTGPLGDDFSLRLVAQGQLASGPLLVIEEIGLGGTGFLRAYDWSERTGDEGVMGSAELRYDWADPFGAIPGAQAYVFVDGGSVGNIDGGFGGGSLASVGGGVRADFGAQVRGDVGIAVPLSGPRYDTRDESPTVNVSVAKSF
jgi:hemolysin activation/secretion protein